jgi:glutamine amidotransferase
MPERPRVAVVDFGLGNIFSVLRACEIAGAAARITSSPAEVLAADGVILPGVGAFRDAMAALDAAGLSDALRSAAKEDKPLFGVCLGLQLLMDESSEFGRHKGLGIIPGRVVRFPERDGADVLKVPHIGWSKVRAAAPERFKETPLASLPDGVRMYFVHSYYVEPAEPSLAVSRSQYGSTDFCSSLASGRIFACQFHPERSGPNGLAVYKNWISKLGVATAP